MKKRWEEPKIGVQKFVPNEYVAACGDAEYIGNYSPCSKKHEASRESEFPDGFVDYNRNTFFNCTIHLLLSFKIYVLLYRYYC